MLRSAVTAERPLIRSSYDGTVSASSPAAAQISATRRRTPCAAEGSAMITLRTPYLRAQSRQRRDRAQDGDVAQHQAPLRRIVVDEPDDAPLRAARELAGEPRAGLAGADDQHRLAERRERAVEPVLLPAAVGEARAGHQEDQQHRVEDQHAARHHRLQLEHHQAQRDQQRAESRRQHDPLQVDEAREAPEPAIESEREEDRALQRHDPRQRPRDVGEVGLAKIEVEAAASRRRSTRAPPRVRSWAKASQARQLVGVFIANPRSATANDNQWRRILPR